MTLGDKGLTQHNYYVDKFDTTAWNDFGANPRKYDPFANDATASTHGSREKMYHLRKINARETCQMLLDQVGGSVVLLVGVWGGEGGGTFVG